MQRYHARARCPNCMAPGAGAADGPGAVDRRADGLCAERMNNGVKFGPKFKLNAFQRREALARLEAGESQSLVAQTYGVDRATISRLQN